MGFKTVSTILNLRITKKLLGDDMLSFITHLSYIITNNVSDFAQAELKHLGYEVIAPEQLLRLLRT